MATSYSASRQTFAPIRLGLSLFNDCCAALRHWHERQRIRAKLFDLNDRYLNDIGISRGVIDYVAAHRDFDPRAV